MADIDRSSDGVSADITEQSSQASKVEFSEDEEILITMVYNLVGERWSLIAGRIPGRIPGRTAEEIEKYWTSRYSTSE
ncbi:transcription factor CPC-like [Gastrolobium bilobum]|uniref:transcription factor CPC-like n=1 Tax=Gastrolobium bilobum TaxID=150636 RepID=UPI002AB01243|nr:transcription factor CPC-like [Gastrolobium bilobum]